MSGMFHAPVMQELMEQFGKLPGIGPKTAQRLAFYVLSLPKNDVRAFADAMVKAKDCLLYTSPLPWAGCWLLRMR